MMRGEQKKSNSFRCAMFDMDGTLMDTMIFWRAVILRILDRICDGRPGYTSELRRQLTLLPVAEAKALLSRTLGISPQILSGHDDYKLGMMECLYRDHACLKEPIAQKLREFHTSGVKTALLTATPRHYALQPLERLGLLPYLDLIYTSDEYPHNKRETTIFLDTLKQFGCTPDETVLYEDSLYSIKTAHSLGIHIHGVYDFCSDVDVPEIRRLSDVFYDLGPGLTEIPEEWLMRYEDELRQRGVFVQRPVSET